mmetsp:Transcript_17284/g.43016  ORF Transcript_17284/g.43016 Transcript_17284/m.43016 type:complete len:631 (+) Transcript_17284:286-2178(+)
MRQAAEPAVEALLEEAPEALGVLPLQVLGARGHFHLVEQLGSGPALLLGALVHPPERVEGPGRRGGGALRRVLLLAVVERVERRVLPLARAVVGVERGDQRRPVAVVLLEERLHVLLVLERRVHLDVRLLAVGGPGLVGRAHKLGRHAHREEAVGERPVERLEVEAAVGQQHHEPAELGLDIVRVLPGAADRDAIAAAQLLVGVAVQHAVGFLGDDDRGTGGALPRLVVAAEPPLAHDQGLRLDHERRGDQAQEREQERLALGPGAGEHDELAEIVLALEEGRGDAVEHGVPQGAEDGLQQGHHVPGDALQLGLAGAGWFEARAQRHVARVDRVGGRHPRARGLAGGRLGQVVPGPVEQRRVRARRRDRPVEHRVVPHALLVRDDHVRACIEVEHLPVRKGQQVRGVAHHVAVGKVGARHLHAGVLGGVVGELVVEAHAAGVEAQLAVKGVGVLLEGVLVFAPGVVVDVAHQQDALLVEDDPGLAEKALDYQVDDVAHLGRARVLVLGEEDVGGQGLVHGLAVLVVVRVEGQLERLDARHERDAERRLDRRAGREGDGREVERAPVARALELVRAVEDAPDAEGARALKGLDDDGERAVLERVHGSAAHRFHGGVLPEDRAGRRVELARV